MSKGRSINAANTSQALPTRSSPSIEYLPANDARYGILFSPRWTHAKYGLGLFLRLVSSYLDQHPSLQGFLLEIRSLVHRIEIRRTKQFDLYGVVFDGPYLEAGLDGDYQLCKRTHACIEDTEHFLASRPWATAVDAEMFQHAWELGAEWVSSNRHRESLNDMAKS
jgi:hypothetical protein